jgi:hypothetical protein
LLGQEVLKAIGNVTILGCGNHFYKALFTTKKTLFQSEVCDKEVMLILSMKMLQQQEKAAGFLAFLPPSLPPAGPDSKSPCNYPQHQSLEGSPSTTGILEGLNVSHHTGRNIPLFEEEVFSSKDYVLLWLCHDRKRKRFLCPL